MSAAGRIILELIIVLQNIVYSKTVVFGNEIRVADKLCY